MDWECDPTHLANLKAEDGMQTCRAAPIPITKDGVLKIRGGNELSTERSRSARRNIAFLNYRAQERPDPSVATRVLAQQRSKPTRRDRDRG